MTELDFDARYRVTTMPGVAFYLRGYAERWIDGDWVLDCPIAGVCDHDDEDCYIWQDPEVVEDTSRVRAVMVGDDREHEIDVIDLVKIDDDDYCSCCGQIGCAWG